MSLLVSVTLTPVTCGVCAGTYGINERYRELKQQEGGSWYCPYCKVSWGYVESENDKLKKQLAQEKHKAEQMQASLRESLHKQIARTERVERRRAAMKGQVTRIRNRVGKGVCPCCNRTFVNLQRHMEGKHPDWAPEVDAEKAAT